MPTILGRSKAGMNFSACTLPSESANYLCMVNNSQVIAHSPDFSGSALFRRSNFGGTNPPMVVSPNRTTTGGINRQFSSNPWFAIRH
ncbi:MAG TPA: hypothetical protein VE243_03175, partial [Candidatus Acidoferrum sp.]|nr:hypothetical protein [Candidatus Acidoferrum sp.]